MCTGLWTVFGLSQFPACAEPLAAVQAKFAVLAEEHGRKTATHAHWIALLRRSYSDAALRKTGDSLRTSRKYMLTRKAGIIDLTHYCSGIMAGLRGSDPTEYALGRQKQDGDFEDLPADYLGAMLGRVLSRDLERTCDVETTVDNTARIVIDELRSYAPIETKQQEDRFLDYVKGDARTAPQIGGWIYDHWDPPLTAPPKVKRNEFYKYNRKDAVFRIFTYNAETRSWNLERTSEGMVRHVNIADIIAVALEEQP